MSTTLYSSTQKPEEPSGAVLEKDCPYTGYDNQCGCPYQHHYWLTDYRSMGSFLSLTPVPELKAALRQYGPLACYMKSSKSLAAYTGGVFNDHSADDKLDVPDHTVVIMGWDDSKGSRGSWLIKNSWGTGWGEGGYGYVEYGVNYIGASAHYIILDASLSVSPEEISLSGAPGGPFFPSSSEILLENKGTQGLNWSAQAPEWLHLSNYQGTVISGGQTTVGVSVNPIANQFDSGTYTGTIAFADHTNNVVRNIAVNLTVARSILYNFPLDSNPGWNAEPDWQFGEPMGQGKYNKDPDHAYTGTNVYGYNLQGNYENNLPERTLTTGALDCRNAQNVHLRFMRWLGVQMGSSDKASVRVSNNGQNWITIWENSLTENHKDTEWTECVYDISAIADGQRTVYIRWVMGSTDNTDQYPGWNLDDIQLWGVPNDAPEGEGGAGPCNPDLDGPEITVTNREENGFWHIPDPDDPDYEEGDEPVFVYPMDCRGDWDSVGPSSVVAFDFCDGSVPVEMVVAQIDENDQVVFLDPDTWMNTPGIYLIGYTAEDSSGNKSMELVGCIVTDNSGDGEGEGEGEVEGEEPAEGEPAEGEPAEGESVEGEEPAEGEVPALPHPADIDGDGILSEKEVGDYISGWQKGTNSMTIAIRAFYLLKLGGSYSYDPTLPEPECWFHKW